MKLTLGKIKDQLYATLKFKVIDIKTRILTKCMPLKIVVGASGYYQSGWIPTDMEHVNLLDSGSWSKYFRENSLEAILVEHVWEHLTKDDALLAAKNCYNFLKPNAYVRVAVPDGYHPLSSYVEAVKPGGTGAGAKDHKVLYNYASLSNLFKTAGFDIELLEWFDEKGAFHKKAWRKEAGFIRRSSEFDSRNKEGHLNYTSIILDAKKSRL